ncbi:MAG: VWA domain-containing protein [Acidobacteria bacterium]|nr:MAG: VWA domain-containing protein [Acidobacteriota bacterium]
MPSSRRSPKSDGGRRGPGLRLAAPLLCAAMLSGGGALAAGGTEAPPLEGGYREKVDVRLALLEVVVVDHKGRHVRNLPRSAFTLKERKRPIPIVSFDEIDLAAPAAAKPRAEPRAKEGSPGVEAEPAAGSTGLASSAVLEAARKAARARLDNPRWFAIVFDGYNNPSPLRISQMRRAAKQWLRERLRPKDRVAVYEMTPFLRSLCSFTSDIETLEAAIDAARVFPGTSIGQEMTKQRIEQGGALRRDILEQQLLNSGRFGSDLLAAERDQFYTNVDDIARALAQVEGTKAVLLFTGGFPLTRSRTTNARGGFTSRFRDMLASLQDAGIRVFTYDVGVEGGFADASVAQNFRDMLDQIGLGSEWLDVLQLGAQVDAANAHREIHVALAGETGGRFWRNRDFLEGLRAADDDLSHYYLIGYRPSDLSDPSRAFVPLKVEVEGRGLRAISARGRVAPRPAARTARAARADSAAPGPATAVPVPLRLSCEPLFYPGQNGRTLVLLPVRVSGPPPDAQEIALEVRLAARLSGMEIAGDTRKVSARLRSEPGEGRPASLYFLEAMELPPMELELEIAVRTGSGAEGRWRRIVAVPARSRVAFGITRPVLLEDPPTALPVYDVFGSGAPIPGAGRDTAGEVPPLAPGPGRPLPVVRGLSAVPAGSPVPVAISVLAPPPPPAGEGSPLRLDWELVPEGGGASAEPLLPPVTYRLLAMRDEGHRLDILAVLDLRSVPAGDYSLRVIATKVPGGQTAQASSALRVISPE